MDKIAYCSCVEILRFIKRKYCYAMQGRRKMINGRGATIIGES